MSKLELDDQILNHRKFVRVVRSGGAEAIFAWLGIRAYVGQNLSDGFVPADMVDELRGPQGEKRQPAIDALSGAKLIHVVGEDGRVPVAVCARCAVMTEERPFDGPGLLMHDFLQWSRSKSQVLADRERARTRQAKSQAARKRDSRRKSHRDDRCDDGVNAPSSTTTSASPTPSATTPKPPGVVDPMQTVRCPVPLPVGDETYAALELDIGMPRAVAEAALRAFAVDRAATKETRRIDTWISWALKTVRGQWSTDKAAMRAAAEPQPEERTGEHVATYADVLAKRKGAA